MYNLPHTHIYIPSLRNRLHIRHHSRHHSRHIPHTRPRTLRHNNRNRLQEERNINH